MILASAGCLHAQENPTDDAALKGEWQLEKVKAVLYAQEGNKLLEERTYVPDSTSRLNVLVPLTIRLMNGECTMEHKAGRETGAYILPVNGMLRYQVKDQPARLYDYQLSQPAELALNMPTAFYRDNTRQRAVKLVYTCYYRKKQ